MKKFVLIFLLALTATFFYQEFLMYADETQQVEGEASQTGPRSGPLDEWLERHPEEKARLDVNQDGSVDVNERRAALQAFVDNRPQLPQLPASTPIGAAQRLKNRPRPLLERAPWANSKEAPPAQEQGETTQDQGQTTTAP